MSAAASPYDGHLQRAQGQLRIAWRTRDGRTALADLRQQGCLKARFPRPVDWPEAVLLNSSGGIAGGDQLAIELEVGQGAQATISAQAAERFYRARPADPPARVATTLTVGESAAAEWLPQESILFDAASLHRTLDIHMEATASVLAVETLVFGRALMGETVQTLRLSDTIRLTRAGRLELHDATRLQGEIQPILARRATAAGARAMATILLAAPTAATYLQPLRDTLSGDAAASTWNNLLVARLLAPTAAALRANIVAALTILRDGRPLPRVWNC
jgi:urease accessory protein